MVVVAVVVVVRYGEEIGGGGRIRINHLHIRALDL